MSLSQKYYSTQEKSMLYSMVLQKRPFFIHYIPHDTWLEKKNNKLARAKKLNFRLRKRTSWSIVAVYIFNTTIWLEVIHSLSCFSSAFFLLSLSFVANNCEWFPVSCCKAINQISLQIWLTHSVDAASGSKGLTYQKCLCGKNNNNQGQKYLIFHRLCKVFLTVFYLKYLFLQ